MQLQYRQMDFVAASSEWERSSIFLHKNSTCKSMRYLVINQIILNHFFSKWTYFRWRTMVVPPFFVEHKLLRSIVIKLKCYLLLFFVKFLIIAHDSYDFFCIIIPYYVLFYRYYGSKCKVYLLSTIYLKSKVTIPCLWYIEPGLWLPCSVLIAG